MEDRVKTKVADAVLGISVPVSLPTHRRLVQDYKNATEAEASLDRLAEMYDDLRKLRSGGAVVVRSGAAVPHQQPRCRVARGGDLREARQGSSAGARELHPRSARFIALPRCPEEAEAVGRPCEGCRYTPNDAVRPGVRVAGPQRELRGRQDTVPRAADGHSLRPPGDARRPRHRQRRRRSPAARVARPRLARRHPPHSLRRHLRGSVLLRRTSAGWRLRRRRCRPPAHRAQPQRRGHDDVPDAAAGADPAGRRGGDRAARRALRHGRSVTARR